MTSATPPPEPISPQPATGTSIGLDPQLAGLLAYAFGWVSGLVILLLEKDHATVRFHAAQSIVVFGTLTVFWTVVSAIAWIPVLGWAVLVVGLLVAPLALVLWIVLMLKGYQLADLRLPLVAGVADRLVGTTSSPTTPGTDTEGR